MGRLGKVDPSSYSQPELITTEHSDIKWEVDFASTKLRGSVLHKFNVLTNNLDKIVSSLSNCNFRDFSLIFYELAPGCT